MFISLKKNSELKLKKLVLVGLSSFSIFGLTSYADGINVNPNNQGLLGPGGIQQGAGSSEILYYLKQMNTSLTGIKGDVKDVGDSVNDGNKISMKATSTSDASNLYSDTVNTSINALGTFKQNYSQSIIGDYQKFDDEVNQISCYSQLRYLNFNDGPTSSLQSSNTVDPDNVFFMGNSDYGSGQSGLSNGFTGSDQNNPCSTEKSNLVSKANDLIRNMSNEYKVSKSNSYKFKDNAFKLAKQYYINKAMGFGSYTNNGMLFMKPTNISSYSLLGKDSGNNLENFAKLWLGRLVFTNPSAETGISGMLASNIKIVKNSLATVAKVKSSNRNNDAQEDTIQQLLSQQLNTDYLKKISSSNVVQLTRIMVINGIVNNYLQNKRLKALQNIEEQNNASLLLQTAALTDKLTKKS